MAAVVVMLGIVPAARQAPDVGSAPQFVTRTVLDGLYYPTNLEFAPDGRVFVTEKRGSVLAFDDLDDESPTLVADLGDEIHDYEDRGLLGLAVDPDFPDRPYLYVLYTLDRDGQWDDSCPFPPGAFLDGCVVDGRLSRLTVDENSQLVGDEKILLEDLWCAQYPSHTVADLLFAPDGALLVSAGEGANYGSADYGQHGGSWDSPVPPNPCGDPPGGEGVALAPPDSEGGALRSQAVVTGDTHTYDGAVLRIDPDTAEAHPGNPLVGEGDDLAERIVAHGLRNPFRMASRPGTDEVWIANVGWEGWEEVERIADPSDGVVENFGWPCYEGPDVQESYAPLDLDVCRQLEDGNDLRTTLTEPFFAYPHEPERKLCGQHGGGSAAVSALEFYGSGEYPPYYESALFFGDYVRGCIWAMPPDDTGDPDPSRLEVIAVDAYPVDLETGPDGDMFWVDVLQGTVERVVYVGEDIPPTASATVDVDNGPLPLAVQFDGTGSETGVRGDVTYEWDLDGDGQYDDNTSARPTFTYDEAGEVTAGLRVTNSIGASNTTEVVIHPGNSRPEVEIEAPAEGTRWEVEDELELVGKATDPEDGGLAPETFVWQVDLHHCSTPTDCHVHPLETIRDEARPTIVAPDHEHPAFLELTLTARDGSGLSGSTSVRLEPRTIDVRFETEPAGLTLTVGSRTETAPFTHTVIAGSRHTIVAEVLQELDDVPQWFDSWSDGGDQVHAITVTKPTTYTATYKEEE